MISSRDVHPMHWRSSVDAMHVSEHCRNYIHKITNACYSIIGPTVPYKATFEKQHAATQRVLGALDTCTGRFTLDTLNQLGAVTVGLEKVDTEQD